jgi:hypothetical protein
VVVGGRERFDRRFLVDDGVIAVVVRVVGLGVVTATEAVEERGC